MKSEPENNRRFWLLSGIVHVSILVILFLSPVGQSIFQPVERPLRPEVIRKDEALAEVIEEIRDLAADRLKSQVALLEAGRERMATNFDTMNAHFQPFVARQIGSARDRLLQEGQKTLALQKRILDAAERAVKEKEHASDAMWRAYDGNRAALVIGQEEIRRALMLTIPDDPRLVTLQNEAEASQEAAFEALTESVSAQNHLWKAPKNIETLEGQVRDLEAQVASYHERIESAVIQQKELQEAIPEAQNELKAAEQAFEELQKQGDSVSERDLKRAGDSVKQRLTNLERLLGRVEAAIKQEENLIGRLEGTKERLAARQTQLETARTELPGKTEARDAQALLAAEHQRKAIASQTEVYEQLLEVLEAKAKEEAAGGTEADPAPSTTGLEETS